MNFYDVENRSLWASKILPILWNEALENHTTYIKDLHYLLRFAIRTDHANHTNWEPIYEE